MTKTAPPVLIMMGSDSDWPVLEETAKTLDKFQIGCDVQVCSAHRTPQRAMRLAAEAAACGVNVFIAAGGGAAHLAGVVAAHTTLPVVGVPVKGWALDGLDSLLSTVQMPAGIPVATVAIGKAGAINAAILAVQMLSLSDPQLAERLAAHRREQAEKVDRANDRLREQRGGAA